jgi:tetratricopeptide (TPR) repeat protein
MRARPEWLLAAALCAAGPRVASQTPAAQAQEPVKDSLVLKDGRMFEGWPIKHTDKGVTLHLQNGDIDVGTDLIKEWYSASGDTGYQPQTDEERKKVEQGLALVGGKWVVRKDYEKEIEKRNAATRKRIAEAKDRREWRNAAKAESLHFKFEHTLPTDIFNGLRDLLETYYAVFTKKWGLNPTMKLKPLVCLYSDEHDFHRISGAPPGVIGYFAFTKVPVELDLYYDRLDPRLTLDVLFHEGNHLLTHMVNEKFMYPPWINESMAEYFGASRWDPVKKEMSIGHLQAGRLMVVKQAIKKDEWLKLKDMIEMERFGSLHYAWGWSFVHFLESTEKYKKPFERFYLDLSSKSGIKRVPSWGVFRTVESKDQIEMLLKALGAKSLDDLQKEWYDYIKGLEVQDAAGFDEAGRLMRIMGRRKEAREYLAKAVELGSGNAATYAAYGETLIQDRNYKQAIEMLDKALQLDPLTAKYWFWKGSALHFQGGAEQKAEGLRLIKLAAELDPEDTEIQFYLDNLNELDTLASEAADKGKGG